MSCQIRDAAYCVALNLDIWRRHLSYQGLKTTKRNDGNFILRYRCFSTVFGFDLQESSYCWQLSCLRQHLQLAAPRYRYIVAGIISAPAYLYQPPGHLPRDLLSVRAAADCPESPTSFGDFGKRQTCTSLKIHVLGVDQSAQWSKWFTREKVCLASLWPH